MPLNFILKPQKVGRRPNNLHKSSRAFAQAFLSQRFTLELAFILKASDRPKTKPKPD
jgi:hypothetical protein